MSGGRDPPLTGGEFLLSLLQKQPPNTQQHHQQHHVPDPAVAALGPIARDLNPNLYLQGSNQPLNWLSPIGSQFQGFSNFPALDSNGGGLGLGFQVQPRQEPLLTFGSFSAPVLNRDPLHNGNLIGFQGVPINSDRNGLRPPPPGFIGAGRGTGGFDRTRQSNNSEDFLAGRRILGDLGLSKPLDQPGPPAGSKLHSVGASDVEESMRVLHSNIGGQRMMNASPSKDLLGDDEIDELNEKIVDSLGIDDDEVDDSTKKFLRIETRFYTVVRLPDDMPISFQDARSDTRGHQMLNQRQRIYKRQVQRRADILRLDSPLIAIYESLIPTEEEKLKQKQLLGLLETLVNREWPNAKLYIYGSCANSFGVSKSDIDICFALEGADNNKPEILLRLAEILESDNFKNVQALVRARVPIVKLMDPATDISCDICINNVLAVVNSKLLRDYARIDVRLRQLAFIVKHWAKSRRVNETYHGTLSSYAYVLMCIHFLQQRRPAILPCLQGMKTTYSITIENIHCAFFDRVDQIQDYGHRNNESISQLVWSFFNYWAYGHDYANSVISVRTGTLLSKRTKDWTRRIGNDRHLICIEDPFETSHDLGRVVDKHSIKVLREEFERAAEVLQQDPNPCVKLFEPYVPS